MSGNDGDGGPSGVTRGNRPLSILILSSYLPGVGGGELQTALQVRDLIRRGHRVRVIDLGTHTSGTPSHEKIDGAEVYRVPAPDIPKLGGVIAHVRTAVLLTRILSDTDIVHFNHVGTQLIITRLLAGAYRVPVVVVVWGSSRPGIGPFRRGLRWRLARQAARGAQAIVALSTETRRNLVRQGFPEDRLTFIPNGLDLTRFRPDAGRQEPPPGAPQGQPRVLSVGRLVPAKGYDLLLEAWATVRLRHPGAVLAIVGEGPERGRLERLRMDLDLGPQAHLVGTRNDIESWLRWADLYVSSSRTEGMSNALLEALGAGLPVLATRVGGAEDVVLNGTNGLLIEPESVAGLEKALLDLLARPADLRTMGIAARRKAEQELSIDAVVRRYEQLYRETLHRAPSGRTRA